MGIADQETQAEQETPEPTLHDICTRVVLAFIASDLVDGEGYLLTQTIEDVRKELQLKPGQLGQIAFSQNWLDPHALGEGFPNLRDELNKAMDLSEDLPHGWRDVLDRLGGIIVQYDIYQAYPPIIHEELRRRSLHMPESTDGKQGV